MSRGSILEKFSQSFKSSDTKEDAVSLYQTLTISLPIPKGLLLPSGYEAVYNMINTLRQVDIRNPNIPFH